MEIKRFEEKYNDLVNQFIISIFLEEFGFEQYRNVLEKESNIKFQESGGDLWIYFDDDGKIIGTVAVENIEEDKMILKKMYVNKMYRGKGIAQELLDKVLEFCKENVIKEIVLGTFQELGRAIQFYIKNGFEEIEGLRRDDGARFFKLEINYI